MREGARVQWLTTIPYTTETHSPSINFFPFLLLGKISATTGISFEMTYQIFRFIASILFFASAYIFIRSISIPHKNLTYLIFLFASPFLMTTSANGTEATVPYLYWWTGIDAVRRGAYLPHHMLGGTLLILAMMVILKFHKSGKWRDVLVSILILPFLILVHPPSLFILMIVIPSAILLYVIFQMIIHATRHNFANLIRYLGKNYKKELIILSVPLLAFLLTVAYIFIMEQDPLWAHAILWEKNQQLSILNEIFGAFGILLPFALVGLISSILSFKFPRILIASWFIIPLILLPIAPVFNISNTRLIQGIPFFPFSILAMIGITDVTLWISQMTEKNIMSVPKRLNIQTLLIGLIFGIFLIQSGVTISWSVRDQIREFQNRYSNIYLDTALYPAFDFINRTYSPQTITVSAFYTGNFLPAFTDTISYIGHFGYTYDLNFKEPEVNKLLKNQMTEKEARQFLTDHKIRLVFQGPDERSYYSGLLYPNILKPVYQQSGIVLYELIP